MDDISDRTSYLRGGSLNNQIKSTPRFRPMFLKESFPSIHNIDENNSSIKDTQ
jgi:hypothetical protein